MIGKPNHRFLTTGIATLLITLAVLATILATTMASGDALAITGLQAPEVPENSTSVASYTTNAPEDTTVTWSIEGTDRDLLSMTGGTLTFLAPPDYENPADHDSDNVYKVTLNANTSDPDAQSASLDVRITVQDVNEPPSPTAATMVVDVGIGTTTQADLTTWFEDPEGDTLSFTMTTPRDTSFQAIIDGDQLTLTASGEKRETSVTVRATDGQTSSSMTATVKITRGSYPPGPVQNLQAEPTNDGFTLTWDAPAYDGGGPIFHHGIEYRVDGSTDNFMDSTHQSSSRTHYLRDLEPDTTYEIKVRACNRARSGFSTFIIRCGSYSTITATTLGAMLEFTHAEYFPQFYINALSASTLPYASTDDVDNPPGVTYSITGLSTLIALADDVAFDDTTRTLSGEPHSPGTAVLTLTATATSGQTASTTITVNIQRKLAPPTNLVITPIPAEQFFFGISRAVQLTWSGSANRDDDTIYDVYIQEGDNPPRKMVTPLPLISDESQVPLIPELISDPSKGTPICLDDPDCHHGAPRTSKGLREFDHIDVWVAAKQKVHPVSLAESENSETVRIIPGPITTIDGNANEHGEGNVQVRWNHPQDATSITIRWRPLGQDISSKQHDHYNWTLDASSLPMEFKVSDVKHVGAEMLDANNLQRKTALITGLQPKTPYAVQLNFTQSTGDGTPDRKVFSGVDHYVYPSDESADDGDRITSIPLRQYLSDKTYTYVFCEDTFEEPTETWLSLIRHAFDEWIMATDGLIQAPRLLETNGDPAECADYDSIIEDITTLVEDALYLTEEFPPPVPSTDQVTSYVNQLINAYADINLKSNQNLDKNLNEIRMVNDSRYLRYLPELAFHQLVEASGLNVSCVTLNFMGCAVPYTTNPYRILPEVHRSTDIYIKRSRTQPAPPAQLSTAYFPGTDSVWHERDVQFNFCTNSAFTPPSGPMAQKQPGNVYTMLIHEIGHALGLHNADTYDPEIDQSSHHPNPNILQSMMKHQTVTGQDCSPHPLDIMALYTIHQTVE